MLRTKGYFLGNKITSVSSSMKKKSQMGMFREVQISAPIFTESNTDGVCSPFSRDNTDVILMGLLLSHLAYLFIYSSESMKMKRQSFIF